MMRFQQFKSETHVKKGEFEHWHVWYVAIIGPFFSPPFIIFLMCVQITYSLKASLKCQAVQVNSLVRIRRFIQS